MSSTDHAPVADAARTAPAGGNGQHDGDYVGGSVQIFKDTAHMAKDNDLDALRDRPDFQKLMAGALAEKN